MSVSLGPSVPVRLQPRFLKWVQAVVLLLAVCIGATVFQVYTVRSFLAPHSIWVRGTLATFALMSIVIEPHAVRILLDVLFLLRTSIDGDGIRQSFLGFRRRGCWRDLQKSTVATGRIELLFSRTRMAIDTDLVANAAPLIRLLQEGEPLPGAKDR